MLEYRENFCQMLRMARTAVNQSQQEVANVLGVNRATYTYYELGRTTPDLDTLKCLLQLFHLTPEDIFYPEKYLGKNSFKKGA